MCISAPLKPAFVLVVTIEFEADRGGLFKSFGRKLSGTLGAGLIKVISVLTFIGSMKVTGAKLAPEYCFTPTCECFSVQIKINYSPVQRL